MARRRDFVRGAAAIAQRRLTTWVPLVPLEVTMVATGGTLIASLNAAALALRPFTVVRAHLHLGLRSDQAASIENQAVGVGLAVVSDQAVAVGVTAVPTPITDIDSEFWFLHQLLYADESNLTDRTRSGQYMEVDSKAMRKVSAAEDIIFVGEKAGISDGVILTIGGRLLIKNN